MAMATPDDIFDEMLAPIATATRISVCSDQPANFAGIAAVLLASKAITPGEFSFANGDVSGRKAVIAQVADAPITATGEGDHIVLDDGVRLVYVTTATAQQLTSGGDVTLPSWKVEIADPVAA